MRCVLVTSRLSVSLDSSLEIHNYWVCLCVLENFNVSESSTCSEIMVYVAQRMQQRHAAGGVAEKA